MEFDKILNVLFSSLKEVFEKQCSAKISIKDDFKIPPGDKWESGDSKNVFSVASMRVDDENFSCAFCFPEEIFLKYTSAMFKTDINELTLEIRDMVSEFLNMSLCNAKKKFLDDLQTNAFSAIPMTLLSPHLEVSSTTHNPLTVYSLTSDLGTFSLLIMNGEKQIITWDQSF